MGIPLATSDENILLSRKKTRYMYYNIDLCLWNNLPSLYNMDLCLWNNLPSQREFFFFFIISGTLMSADRMLCMISVISQRFYGTMYLDEINDCGGTINLLVWNWLRTKVWTVPSPFMTKVQTNQRDKSWKYHSNRAVTSGLPFQPKIPKFAVFKKVRASKLRPHGSLISV